MKKNNNHTTIIIAVFTIVTVLIWIAADIYHISVSSTIPEDMKQVIAPFNPNLDTQIFDELKNKKNTSEFSGSSATSSSFETQPSALPQITPTTPVSTESSTTSSGQNP